MSNAGTSAPTHTRPQCPYCGGRVIAIETFARDPRAALDADAITSNRPSPDCNAAEGAHHRRLDPFVRLRSATCAAQLETLESSALQRLHRKLRGLHEPWPPLEELRPARQMPLPGQSRRGGTVKSP